MFDLLFSDGVQRRLEANRKKNFEDKLVPNAEAWDEDKTPFREELCLLGDTFSPVRLFDKPAIPATRAYLDPVNVTLSPCGKFLYARRVLPRGSTLGLYQGRRRGSACFTTAVEIPILAEILPTEKLPKVWMSITPQEVISQRPGVRSARGTVLVGGLGMGWFLQKVCARDEVDKVILVEKSANLLDWLLGPIQSAWPHVKDKLKEVIVGDAIQEVDNVEADKYLLDIWEGYGEARRDKAFQAARQKHGNFLWGWGDVDRGKA